MKNYQNIQQSILENKLPTKQEFISRALFLSDKNIDRYPTEIVFCAEFIFQKPFVRVFDVLGQIAEKGKLGMWGMQLGSKLYFDILTL